MYSKKNYMYGKVVVMVKNKRGSITRLFIDIALSYINRKYYHDNEKFFHRLLYTCTSGTGEKTKLNIWIFVSVSLGGDFEGNVRRHCLGQRRHMRNQLRRLMSFHRMRVNISCNTLAAAGFFATGVGDEAMCFCCGVTHNGWRPGDDPISIHHSISPQCNYASGNDTTNVSPTPFHWPSSSAGVLENQRQPLVQTTDAADTETINGRHDETTVAAPSLQEPPLSELSDRPNDTTGSHSEDFQGAKACYSRLRSEVRESEVPTDVEEPPNPSGIFYGSSLNRDLTGGSVCRDEEMCHESSRVQSYRSVLVQNCPIRLSQSGFYATGRGDETCCYSCKRTHRSWRRMDHPDQIHRAMSPDCHHLNGIDQRNVPVSSSASENGDSETCGTTEAANSVTDENISRAEFPKFTDLTSRVDSYQKWPSDVQDPKDLARAGFFYTGYHDCVRCFYCGVGLSNWERLDDPWMKHARLGSSCHYVEAVMHQEFINQALERRHDDTRPGAASTTTERECGTELVHLLSKQPCKLVLEMGFSRDCVLEHALQIVTAKGVEALQIEILLNSLLGEAQEEKGEEGEEREGAHALRM